jgi:MFS family permease
VNRFFLIGLGLGLAMALAYACLSHYNGEPPSLPRALNVLISTVGATGAIRLAGFVFTDQFVATVHASNHDTWWGVSLEDALFILAGGLALFWVSWQEVWNAFKFVPVKP